MISRREFNFRLAGILAVAAPPAHLPEAAEHATKSGTSTPSSSPASEEGLSQTEHGEVESRYQNVLRVWGHRLSNEQRERVHRVLVANTRMMQPMRAFPLDNGDPPALVLRVATNHGSAADGKQSVLRDRRE